MLDKGQSLHSKSLNVKDATEEGRVIGRVNVLTDADAGTETIRGGDHVDDVHVYSFLSYPKPSMGV